MRNDLTAPETGLALLRRDLWPLPLHPPGASIPTKGGTRVASGKEPIGSGWGVARPTEDDLQRRFDRHPEAGVGLLLGPAGGVIDIEGDGPEGEASLLKLFGGEVVETLGWSSRRGPHRLFRWDDRLAELGKTKIVHPDLPDLEIRLGGDGAQMQSAVPPSVGEHGTPRRWNDIDDIAALPEAALRFLIDVLPRTEPAEQHEANGRGRFTATATDPAAAWFRRALEGEAGKVALAPEGARHAALLAAARTVGGMLHHGYLAETDAMAELTHAGRRAGLPETEVAETVRDGLAYGRTAPLPWPEKLGRRTGDGSHAERPWPPLRTVDLPMSPAFPVDVFPPRLRAYCIEAAAALQVPVDLVGAVMLAVAGAAIGQSVNLSLARTWAETALLYLILVARPGTAKSPTIRAVGKPLAEIDRRLRGESKEARAAWEERKRAHEKSPKTAPPPGPEPPQRRAIVKDITRESLAIILDDNPRGVLCDPDEASGWVGSFNEYKSKGGSDRQFWLSVWSCAPISVDRKGGRESYYVAHPFIGVVGGMPPSMLGSLSEQRGRDDGFLDRCLFAYPDPGAFPPQRWTRAALSEIAEKDWADAIGRLYAMVMIVDEKTEAERPYYVPFAPEAERRWGEWYNRHNAETEDADFNDDLAGAWSKMRAHAARFALILSRLWLACDRVADPRSGPVGAEHVRGATELASYFKSQAERARHAMTGGVGSADATAVVAWLRRTGRAEFRAADISADLRRFRRNPTALDSALKALVTIGAVRLKVNARPPGPGRPPSAAYETHPDLLSAPENTGNPENPPQEAPEPPISGINGISWQVHAHGAADREVIEL